MRCVVVLLERWAERSFGTRGRTGDETSGNHLTGFRLGVSVATCRCVDEDAPVADETRGIVLSTQDLREVTGYAAESAREVLEIFESAHPTDSRPRDAIDAARTFARGGDRGKPLRDTAWAALKAARDADGSPAGDAARAAMSAAAAAYLHALADAHQVKHILGAAAHAARAVELVAGGRRAVGAERIEQARRRAGPAVVDVLRRYPPAPSGGGRVGELLRDLDAALRSGRHVQG